MDRVEIFSDGSCSGNPGPGGWGSIIRCHGKESEISGGKKHTTNNEMELTGVIEALRSLKEPSEVTATTDSQYVVKGMSEWIAGWVRNGWKTSTKQPVKNREHWEELLRQSKIHKIKWVWIRGHDGHPENTRCDRLAQDATARLKHRGKHR